MNPSEDELVDLAAPPVADHVGSQGRASGPGEGSATHEPRKTGSPPDRPAGSPPDRPAGSLPDRPAAAEPASSIPTTAERARPSTTLVTVSQPTEALPVLARATATGLLRAAAWGVGTTLRVGSRIARAATDPDAATSLYGELSDGVRNYARELLGISELEREVRGLVPLSGTGRSGQRMSESSLRAQGAELLRAAAEVGFDQSVHPAYARFLSELAPDEARVLRLLASAGAQPLVDIRQGNLIGLGSQLIAPSMNMLGAQAGVRHRDRVPVYLSNLGRLGLVELSDTPVGDPMVYQVLEAQPDVLGMIKQTVRAKTVHRRLALTALGVDFCDVCLPVRLPELPSGD